MRAKWPSELVHRVGKWGLVSGMVTLNLAVLAHAAGLRSSMLTFVAFAALPAFFVGGSLVALAWLTKTARRIRGL